MSNLDDFDQPPHDFEDEEEQPRARKQSLSKNLSDAWSTSPVFKIFLLLVGGGAIASAALGVFNSDKPKDTKSSVQESGNITATPGGEAPPAFQEAVNEASNQRAQSAIQQGGSALPTPMGNTTQMTNLDPSQQDQNDPLREFRAQQEQNNQQPAPAPTDTRPRNQQQQQPQQAINQEPPLDQNMAQAMQQQMQSLVGSWAPSASRVIKVSDANTAPQTGGTGNNGGTGTTQQPFDYGKTLVQAGTINYGQLSLEANSDVPGPVMAQILSGPFNGARAVGSFQTVEGQYNVIKFNLINFKGKDYQVDILALDPDTTLGGLATETDQRYWSRVILPAAAEFISGFAEGFSQADTSVTISDGVVVSQRASGSLRQGFGQGTQEAGDRVAQIVNDQASKIKPLVKVAAGTPIGLFFTKSVTENTPTPQQQQAMGLIGVNGLNGVNGQAPYGQQGYGTTGYNGAYQQGAGYGMTGYAGQNPYSTQGYAYPTTSQTVNNPYGPLNNSSSSTNYGNGITVVPTGGYGGATVINPR